MWKFLTECAFPGNPLAKSMGSPDRNWNWLELVSALLPPDGGTGSGQRKTISCRCDALNVNLLGRPTPIFQSGGGGTKDQES